MFAGILYGLGDYSLARALSCTPAEAGVLKKQVLARMGLVTGWQQECVDRARRAGFIEVSILQEDASSVKGEWTQ